MNPLEVYLKDLRDIRGTGAAVAETSFYPALSNLLNEIGKGLKPKVRCVINIANRGAGLPDGGFFTADQIRKDDPNPMQGQLPSRGVLEAKPLTADVRTIAATKQVKGYLDKYGLVLVTDFREFLLLGRDAQDNPLPMESYILAESEAAFWEAAAHPQKTAEMDHERFTEYLKRVMLSTAPLSDPRDVAWFLASYARDAKGRVENHKDLSALKAVRGALEEALGMKFSEEKGEHFFRSTLVQTIFYGVFSAWVLWHREGPDRTDTFDWRKSSWSLRVPFIRALYEQIATPTKLGDLGLVEVLDWTTGALNRVNRDAFFQKFEDEHAVQYFYEPFLEAFDPDLRKELGVWYTPPEIVKYQVARVDTVLRTELGLADGLADPNVVVLDPCCGTGAYLVEVLRKIAETLRAKGGDALIASDLKKAAMTRVFGFEILPAPFVVSHLRLGLMLHDLGAPLSATGTERVGVYLTNSLTGWEPPQEPKQKVVASFIPELKEEKDAADHVKRDTKILVVLGNPPYNAFAGVSPEEERGLVEPYKGVYTFPEPHKKERIITKYVLNDPPESGGWGIKKFNLDDLYVRFFRLAERRIAELTGKGVVSFISNHSWISEPSFVILREHLLKSFDRFWIENLHGNRKISEYAPDGHTSETIFAMRGFSVGIQQGVATSLWVKTGKTRNADESAEVLFRNDLDVAKAEERRQQLLSTLNAQRFDAAYTAAKPCRQNRYSFRPESVSAAYNAWPSITDIVGKPPSHGHMETRGLSLIAHDRELLSARMKAFLDPTIDNEAMRKICPELMRRYCRYDGEIDRARIIKAGAFSRDFVRGFYFKPFDHRFCYADTRRPLWSEPSTALASQTWAGNAFFIARLSKVKDPEGTPFYFLTTPFERDVISGHARAVPVRLLQIAGTNKANNHGSTGEEARPEANLSLAARAYLTVLGIEDPDSSAEAASLIWLHALAMGYSPAYLSENADGIRRDWPHIPLPETQAALKESAALGRQVAALLDTHAEVLGMTAGVIEPIIRTVAVLTKVGGGELDPDAGDLALTAGWGHAGKAGVTMPAKGRIVQRAFDNAELDGIAYAAKTRGLSQNAALALLGADTRDVYLNEKAYWKNVPASVWEYYIGGYQVIKKWLSYREQKLLGRALKSDEAREVSGMARRLTKIVLLQSVLDANYKTAKDHAYAWPKA